MSDSNSNKLITVIAVAIIAVVLIGEVVVYTSDYTDYSADASASDGNILYSVSADGSKTYSVVVTDNGTYTPVKKLYLYYDPAYPENYNDVNVSVGAQKLDQRYYLEQMVYSLEYRNFHDVGYVDADGLREIMMSSTSDGSSSDIGIVVISGALPDTVYTGQENDVIFGWLSSGGSLYWAGNLLGECYATSDGRIEHVEDYQNLFFGSECLNTGETNRAYGAVENGYREALSLSNNQVAYGVDPSMLPSDRKCLSAGYTEDGYVGTAFVSFGTGMVCIVGGDYSNYQRNDLVQLIASGLSPDSKLVTVETGSVTRGTESGKIEVGDLTGVSAYIYLGGYYPVYGKLFEF